ncbi:hypothetical protein WYO_3326 [Methylobacterium sp. GXF4]|uniref:DUF29 domain-containing protein n=1 Tax=Methylobacterium sp. GXF4 TaxID=1096546 RepID=UPI000269934D|nr:DUF29 domain-containing protein [Methylobacterium sp. GXF4]EIZ83997.1 hypothetical protein WYO_3326 [Methylobacterium sp. GXF4]
MSAAKVAARAAATGTTYDDDFYTWTREQGARLRARDFGGLDLDNLAEEIESLGRSEFNSLVSAWRLILLHMLKWDHQPDRRTRSWMISIRTHRNRAADLLVDNPGLKSRLQQALERAYRDARDEASVETGLPLRAFPKECPYSWDEMATRIFSIDSEDTLG